MTDLDNKINVHFLSIKQDWETPLDFFVSLNDEFNFTLDPCATKENAKCDKYYTQDDDGLSKSWQGERVFCNPPYGREIGKWVKKSSEESTHAQVVMLIPARTDTRYFHEYIYGKAEIRFIKGRLKFGSSNNSAPFPSMIVIFHNKSEVKSCTKN